MPRSWGLDPVAQDALYRAADAAAQAVHLQPGDLLLVDNHSALHGRTPFLAKRDGSDRWLLRTFVARDLARSIAHRPEGGRIVDINYAALTNHA